MSRRTKPSDRQILEGPERHKAILEMAEKYESEGDLELDHHTAKVSEGDDNGAYVQMWKWVPFNNTLLCKGEGSSNEGRDDGNHEECDEGCPVFDAAEAQ